MGGGGERESRILALLRRIDAGFDGSTINLDLKRPRAAWNAIGSPSIADHCALVAGTNGKGSTTAFMESLLSHHGIRVGVFQSPWLFNPEETVRIDRQPVAEPTLWERLSALTRDQQELTSFELLALSALSILASADISVAVLEIGMGGRDDVVNIVDGDVAVFTPVGMDHTRFLGSDRESIGAIKAGILRPGCAAVVGDANPPASLMDSVVRIAGVATRLGVDYGVEHESRSTWTYRSPEHVFSSLPVPALRGDFQVTNAATAMRACELLDVRLDPERVRHALVDVHLPGRLDAILASPLVFVDVAHNSAAAKRLSEWLSAQEGKAITVVLGMYADKDPERFFDQIRSHVQQLIVVPTTGPRGQSAMALRNRVGSREVDLVMADNVHTGLDLAIERCGSEDLVLVTGSFSTVREAYAWAATR